MIIKLKRVYADYDNADGYRVLVDRLWPRGMKKESLKFDLWEKDITPSTELRKWFHSDQAQNWEEFATRYRIELQSSGVLSRFVDTLKGQSVVTLLYASKNESQNHALVLKSELERELHKQGL
ncbi:DUF488 domain-containing protein [Dysgonomonas macrotermitis]|uniref:Uncharacterized conserved protein YeaO, DUF488 family n=1 Tax=Dysgonomonas macrotermitis TaxID=1346286 RepID=A0A1M4WVN5_9BACT|nr:DUF488 family protein [Dysgonomonas macrotermitis]SHE85296.1 Uncharacterized conserved protein YeaO, DUF488 family [Dysgonomonas macrotermitis]